MQRNRYGHFSSWGGEISEVCLVETNNLLSPSHLGFGIFDAYYLVPLYSPVSN